MYFGDEKNYGQDGQEIISQDDAVTWEDVLKDDDDSIPVVADDSSKIKSNSDDDLIPELDDDVSDDELARILDDGSDDVADVDVETQQQEPSRQRAFDTFGTAEGDIIENDYSDSDNYVEDEYDEQPESQPQQPNKTKYTNMPKQKTTKQAKGKSNAPILLLIAVVVVAIAAYFVLFSKNKAPVSAINNAPVAPIEQPEVVDVPIEGTDGDIPVVNEEETSEVVAQDKNDEATEVVEVKPTGRENPFMPLAKYNTVAIPDTLIDYNNPSIPNPPSRYGKADEKVERMISIAVSGIMYDDQKPSAIITYDDNDYFVQVGDRLDDYKVIQIAKNYVVLAYGKNTYRANIGEEFKVTDFYGNATYLPAKQGGGRQYYSVQDNRFDKDRNPANGRYVSDDDIEINVR